VSPNQRGCSFLFGKWNETLELVIGCFRLILPPVFYGYETLSLTIREENNMATFEKKALRRIFGWKR
jgi:hypothetical protein